MRSKYNIIISNVQQLRKQHKLAYGLLRSLQAGGTEYGIILLKVESPCSDH